MRKPKTVVNDGVVVVESRRLVTLASTHKVWTGAPPVIDLGTLVRLEPPHDATDALIEQVKKTCLAAGAARVRVTAKAAGPLVIAGQESGEPELVVPTFETPRHAVAEMVASSFFADKPALQACVDKYLAVSEETSPTKGHAQVDVGYITGVRLDNWLCFEGESVLKLEPKVYSITAEDVDNPERSNWLGKSSFLRAIVFALTGDYPTKTADGWIHEAEPKGGVDLEFSSGLFVSRWKERGKGTRLEVVHIVEDGTEAVLNDDAAQRFLDEAVIDKKTLNDTSYFEQKETDRFITMGPAERSDTVNGWLGIGWIDEAAGLCRQALSKLCDEEAVVRTAVEQIDTEYGTAIGSLIEERRAASETTHREVMVARQRLEEGSALREAYLDWEREQRDALRRAELVEELGRIDSELESMASGEHVPGLVLRAQELAGEAETKLKVYKQTASVARGEFGGVCPVAGMQCPATDEINRGGAGARQRRDDAHRELASVQDELADARRAYEAAQRVGRERDRLVGTRAGLEKQIQSLRVSSSRRATPPPKPEGGLEDRLLEAQRRHADVMAGIGELERAVKRRQVSLDRLATLMPGIDVHRAAMLVLGRTGVQRVIAEGCLAQIERDGNRAIAQAGIDLQFRVSWASETKQLADACDRCGSAFPSSTRVKTCSRCGAERGRKLSHDLRIVLSNESGGANDLGGVVFKLAAANWLRRYRHSAWSIFMIDEPFGALDRANVRGLSGHLGKLLGEQFGACQSFIVAHHADVLESTPGRIHIVSSVKSGGRPKSRVVVNG
jgi:hypothetical protein